MPTGVDAMLAALKARHVECVFHLPGTQTLSLLAAMRDGAVRNVHVRHEQSAAFGAVGYAKQTGRAGVCVSVPDQARRTC